MRPTFRILLAAIVTSIPVALMAAEGETESKTVESPNGRLRVTFRLDREGRPTLQVSDRGKSIVGGSLGLEFLQDGTIRDGLKIIGQGGGSVDTTYNVSVGKASTLRDHHRALTVFLQETGPKGRRLDLEFRAFDDGVAFRYVIPKQGPIDDFVLLNELTQFSFSDDPTAHALPLKNTTTPYEDYYRSSPVSQLGGDTLIGLPLLLEPAEGAQTPWIAVTEANLTDYAGMYLKPVAGSPRTLAAKLSPLPGRTDGATVLGKSPHASPWRVLMVADNPGRLLESNLIFHLSEPSAIDDTSWIKPGKTTFPWWNGYVLEGVDFTPGVNTATMKHYIDFCAEQGIPYHSLDGLDIAWYGGPIAPEGPTDVTTAAPSIDMPELLRYARENDVRLRLWMHWKALKPQIDVAFPLYEKWGIEGVMVDFMDRDDQEMVRFYHEMAEKAAKHHLTLTLHGAYKPTGMERTWPNVLTYEAALNQEYDKWSERGTPPVHNLDIAFIRMLAGPLDYHQGGMRSVLPGDYRPRDKAPFVQGTRGQQLALYVVYQNHLPMMADYPAAYRGQPGLDFIVDVPTNWDETRVLHAEFGRCLVMARRHGRDWYLGGMAGEEGRELSLPLGFLDAGRFEAKIYQDKPADGPNAVLRLDRTLTSADTLHVPVASSGGFVARLKQLAR